jgi:hypothetical protein
MDIGRYKYHLETTKTQVTSTFTILDHIPFAVTLLPSDSPKHGKTETLTFCVSHAAMEKVTGGLSFAVLKYIMTLRIYPCSIKIIIYIAS